MWVRSVFSDVENTAETDLVEKLKLIVYPPPLWENGYIPKVTE